LKSIFIRFLNITSIFFPKTALTQRPISQKQYIYKYFQILAIVSTHFKKFNFKKYKRCELRRFMLKSFLKCLIFKGVYHVSSEWQSWDLAKIYIFSQFYIRFKKKIYLMTFFCKMANLFSRAIFSFFYHFLGEFTKFYIKLRLF
jgi:hypothetical protein